MRAWRLRDSTSALAPAGRYREDWARTAQMLVAAVIARAALPDSARAVARRSRGLGDEEEAYVYILLGDTTAAFEALERVWYWVPAAKEKQVAAEGADWRFKALVGDPRWPKIPPKGVGDPVPVR